MSNLPVPAAAEGLPSVPTATVEDPHDRARRLVKELSETLNDSFGGTWGAEVYPARLASIAGPTGFFNIRSRLGAWHRGRRAVSYLARLRRMTPDERIQHHMTRLRRALTVREMVR